MKPEFECKYDMALISAQALSGSFLGRLMHPLETRLAICYRNWR
jgi:hypothetical protein